MIYQFKVKIKEIDKINNNWKYKKIILTKCNHKNKNKDKDKDKDKDKIKNRIKLKIENW